MLRFSRRLGNNSIEHTAPVEYVQQTSKHTPYIVSAAACTLLLGKSCVAHGCSTHEAQHLMRMQ